MEVKRYLAGSFLREIRLEAGHTTVKMAQIAGVKTRKTYENWEKNVGQPNANQAIQMFIGCGRSPSDVVKNLTTTKS